MTRSCSLLADPLIARGPPLPGPALVLAAAGAPLCGAGASLRRGRLFGDLWSAVALSGAVLLRLAHACAVSMLSTMQMHHSSPLCRHSGRGGAIGSQRCTVGASALTDRRGRRGHATRDGVELVRLENREVQAADEPLRQGRNWSCQAHFSSTGTVFETRHLRISQTGWRAVSSLVSCQAARHRSLCGMAAGKGVAGNEELACVLLLGRSGPGTCCAHAPCRADYLYRDWRQPLCAWASPAALGA